MRYGVVLILLWIGLLKFTSAEAEAIRPFVENSPFFSWMLPILGLQGVSNSVGIIEVTTAFLMATRPWSAFASVLGSAMAVSTFLITLSFFLTTPNAIFPAFPGLSEIGQFLIKDVLLLGGALWSLGESVRAFYGDRNGNHTTHGR
jgi:uncharacterized membrane protein YkgB